MTQPTYGTFTIRTELDPDTGRAHVTIHTPAHITIVLSADEAIIVGTNLIEAAVRTQAATTIHMAATALGLGTNDQRLLFTALTAPPLTPTTNDS